MVPVITGHESISLKWAWSQHNEHRALVPRLILASLFAGLYLTSELACISTRPCCPWGRS